jgi:hypothetical protein
MSGETKRVTVTKIRDTPAPPKEGGKTRKLMPLGLHRTKVPKHGVLKGGKTARRTPRFEPVRDPAKAPPIRSTRRSWRILTEKGAATRRAKIAEDTNKKSMREIRETLRRHNLNVNERTPDHLAKEIYKNAQEAGMISSG